jgi:hypothetical protein
LFEQLRYGCVLARELGEGDLCDGVSALVLQVGVVGIAARIVGRLAGSEVHEQARQGRRPRLLRCPSPVLRCQLRVLLSRRRYPLQWLPRVRCSQRRVLLRSPVFPLR